MRKRVEVDVNRSIRNCREESRRVDPGREGKSNEDERGELGNYLRC